MLSVYPIHTSKHISPPVKFGRRNRRDSVEGNKTLNTAQLSCITNLNFKASSVRENRMAVFIHKSLFVY